MIFEAILKFLMEMAENSTGFKEIKHEEKLELPDDIKQCIEKNMLIYDELRKYRLRV